MVQKKKLKRVDPGSIEAQKARGVVFAGQPEPTSPVFKAGRGGLTVNQARQALGKQPVPAGLQAGGLPQQPFGPQPAPAQQQQQQGFIQQLIQALGNVGQTFKGVGGKFKEQAGQAGESAKKAALPAAGFALGAASGGALAPVLGAGGAAVSTQFSPQAGRLLTVKEVARKAAIDRLAARSGTSSKVIGEIVQKAQVRQEVSEIIKKTTPTKFAKAVGKFGLKAAGVVISGGVLLTWYALDNIITGQKFFLKEILKGVKDKSISPEEAREALLESITAREVANTFVTKSTELNPALYPFKKLITTGSEADEISNKLTIDQIEEAINLTNIQQVPEVPAQQTDFTGQALSSEEFEQAKTEEQFRSELERKR